MFTIAGWHVEESNQGLKNPTFCPVQPFPILLSRWSRVQSLHVGALLSSVQGAQLLPTWSNAGQGSALFIHSSKVYECCVYTHYLCTTCVSHAHRGQKKALGPLELQASVTHHVVAENRTQGLRKDSHCSQTLRHFSCSGVVPLDPHAVQS